MTEMMRKMRTKMKVHFHEKIKRAKTRIVTYCLCIQYISDEEYDSVPSTFDTITSSRILPWGAPKERSRFPSNVNIETDIRPGEFVMRTLFAEFTIQVS